MMNRNEVKANPKALEAIKKEYAGLADRCCFEKDRRAKADVIAEARRNGEEVQFASLHGIIGEKGFELPEGDPRRKFKGRCVLLGNRVSNQDWATASFADLGNAPTLVEGARITDVCGCLPGHSIGQADAVQAHIQAPMKGPKCYVTLPPEAIHDPQVYFRVQNPVVELKLALYGHPDSPTCWEQHCNEQAHALGFEDVGPEWPSLFIHPARKLLLSIYVDDFKLAGPADQLEEGWRLLRTRITMEDPEPVGLYLGCQQRLRSVKHENRNYQVMEYDMSAFLRQCILKYTDIKAHVPLKTVPTPFLSDDGGGGTASGKCD